jgi:hypothetical protein
MKAGAFLAVPFAGALSLAAATPLLADAPSSVTMKPLMAASLDSGSKHVVSYFLASGGQCKLTLMVSDQPTDDARPSETGARFQVAVEAGGTASFDTENGKSLRFACKPDARSMTAMKVDRVALFKATN